MYIYLPGFCFEYAIFDGNQICKCYFKSKDEYVGQGW